MIDIRIERTWDGDPLDHGEIVTMNLETGPGDWELSIEAPFQGDPAPVSPTGRCERLWEFEVVELFLAASGRRYLELEFGPHGHYLALKLAGYRQIEDSSSELDYGASIRDGRWGGVARIPAALRPEKPRRWNAFAVHGTAGIRRYLAAHPLPGARPDFHRTERFPEDVRLG